MADQTRDEPRRVVVAAGSGRSGTSTFTGVMSCLGLHVPEPQIATGRTNPKGFFEPQWVVDLQKQLLRDAVVVLDDARPGAFRLTAKQAARPQVQRLVREWLRTQLDAHPGIIVKDPRNSWFLPMWETCTQAAGAQPCFATMLRHPAEVVGSKDTYYTRSRFGSASKAANWLNVALATEHATRNSPRVFIRYPDLLEDWRHQVQRVDAALGLRVGQRAGEQQRGRVDDFIDPDLRRVQTSWHDLDVPSSVRDLCEAVWQQLATLATSEGDHPGGVLATLDDFREQYARLYGEARAIVQSSIVAARVEGKRAQTARTAPTDVASEPRISRPARLRARARRLRAAGRR